MGKIGDLAYNIGTSLNKEDINSQRQTITPTVQTLKSLSTNEQLTAQQNNQALLWANEVQRLEGVEDGDGVWDNRPVPPFVNVNNPNARRWNVNNNPHAITVRREIEAIRQIYPSFQGFSSARPTSLPITQEEALEYTRFRIFLQQSRQTYSDVNGVAYREFQRSPYYQNTNTSASGQLNIGRNNANFEVGRHERINNGTITFGQNANQSYHTWRHIDRAGFNRMSVESIIRKDLMLRGLTNLALGKPYNFTIRLNGQSVQYTIYRINENKYNIGRIHPVGEAQ